MGACPLCDDMPQMSTHHSVCGMNEHESTTWDQKGDRSDDIENVVKSLASDLPPTTFDGAPRGEAEHHPTSQLSAFDSPAYETGRRGKLPADGIAARPNRQLYDAAASPSISAADSYQADSPSRLFDETSPNLVILHEKPEHRAIVFMKAQGFSNREIASHSGYTESWVSQVVRQPWARQRILSILHTQGEDAVRLAIQGSALDSVYTLIDIRDNDKAPASARLGAASNLLDRFLGKPTQHVEATHHKGNSSDRVDQIDNELAVVEAETKRLIGGGK